MLWRDLNWFLPYTTLNRRTRRFLHLITELHGQSTKSSFAKNVGASRSSICLGFLSDPWPTSLSPQTIVLLFVVADFWWMSILQVILSNMNCGIQSDRHKHSPYQRILVEVFHFVSWLSTKFLSQIRLDVLKMLHVSTRSAVIVQPLKVVDDVWIFCGRSLCTGLNIQVLVRSCSSESPRIILIWIFSCRSPCTGYKTQTLTGRLEYPGAL